MRRKAKSFKDLIVWQKAHELVLNVYQLTEKFPKSELYGLSSQLRRSAVSIPANIVEGFHRRGKREKVHFFNISESSLAETRYYLILVQDLGYTKTSYLDTRLDEISKLLCSYSKSILTSNF